MLECPCQVQGTLVLRNLRLSLLLDSGGLEGSHNPASIEVLQLVVFGHVGVQLARELFDRTRQLELFHQAVCVFFQLLWLDLFVGVEVVNPLVEVLDLLASLFILASLVAFQVHQKGLGCQLAERGREDVRLEPEELVDHFLVLDLVENVRRKRHHIL